jgi:hypothetical protein
MSESANAEAVAEIDFGIAQLVRDRFGNADKSGRANGVLRLVERLSTWERACIPGEGRVAVVGAKMTIVRGDPATPPD